MGKKLTSKEKDYDDLVRMQNIIEIQNADKETKLWIYFDEIVKVKP